MGRLSHDLVTNILLCLPTKSVVRFRCLSKYYNKLVSDPWFATNHDLLSTPEVHGLFRLQVDYECDSDSYHSTLFCSFHLNTKIRKVEPEYYSLLNFGIVTSCNGLILLVYSESMFCVYNPIMPPRFDNIIPKPETLTVDTEGIDWNLGLVYDPIRLSSTEFRLVLIYRSQGIIQMPVGEEFSIFRFEIFSSTENSWRKCESVVKLKCVCHWISEFLNIGQAVYLNGILHWFMKSGAIITFDVGKEEAKFIIMPPKLEHIRLERCYYYLWFGAAKGMINVIQVSNSSTENIEMWVLVDYENNKWEAVRKKIGGLQIGARPIYFDGERLIFNCGRKNNKLRSFDMKLEEWKKMGRFPGCISDKFCASAFPGVYIPFIPILAPINSITPSSLNSTVSEVARQIHQTLMPTNKKRKTRRGSS